MACARLLGRPFASKRPFAPPALRRALPVCAAAPRRGLKIATDGKWTDAHHDKGIAHVFNANKEWREQMSAADPGFFAELGSGHSPNYLAIGCADARVPLNEIMGLPAGEVFVHRNVGNQVISTDPGVQSSIQCECTRHDAFPDAAAFALAGGQC